MFFKLLHQEENLIRYSFLAIFPRSKPATKKKNYEVLIKKDSQHANDNDRAKW